MWHCWRWGTLTATPEEQLKFGIAHNERSCAFRMVDWQGRQGLSRNGDPLTFQMRQLGMQCGKVNVKKPGLESGMSCRDIDSASGIDFCCDPAPRSARVPWWALCPPPLPGSRSVWIEREVIGRAVQWGGRTLMMTCLPRDMQWITVDRNPLLFTESSA